MACAEGEGNGTTQSYSNVQNYEVMYQTAGGADVSGGGVRQLIIPRRGGNDFRGNFSGVWADGNWQSNNVTDDLTARGLRGGNKVEKIYTFEGAQGGRIIRDKLWFLATARRQAENEFVAGSFYSDGRQAINDQYVENYGSRLTWQATRRDQLTAYADRVFKFLGHGDGGAGYDPATATRLWHRSPLYQQSSAKWTSTLTNKLLLEAGFNQYQAQRNSDYQPGVAKPYGSPEWYGNANRTDTSLGTNTVAAPGGHIIVEPIRNAFGSAMSYVSGSHNIKVGLQKAWGYQNFGTTEFNAALQQVYQNGSPTSVIVSNAPIRYNNYLAGDWGLYAQDAWTRKRMTVSVRLRWEQFSSYVGRMAGQPEENGISRFHCHEPFLWPGDDARYGTGRHDLASPTTCSGTPRPPIKFSATSTAQLAAGLAEVVNPLRPLTATLAWNDANRDNIAQGELGCVYQTPGCEINLAQLPANFGLTPVGCSTLYVAGNTPCATTQVDPDIKREYSVQYAVGVQHALFSTVSVSANYYRVNFYNMMTNMYTLTSGYNPLTRNLVGSASD